MKNTLLFCALLLTSVLCSGNENVQSLKEAVRLQNLNKIDQALEKLGSLSLFNKREVEEVAQVIVDALLKEESNSGTIEILVPAILLTMVSTIIVAAMLNTRYRTDADCNCCLGATVVAFLGALISGTVMINAAKGNTNLMYGRDLPWRLQNSRAILELVKAIPAA